MLFRPRPRRTRAFTAWLLMAVFGVLGVGAHLSGARLGTERQIRAPLLASHIAAVPSARVATVAPPPRSRAVEPTTHLPLGTAVGAALGSSQLSTRRFSIAASSAQAHVRPRRLTFRYDATAPPAGL